MTYTCKSITHHSMENKELGRGCVPCIEGQPNIASSRLSWELPASLQPSLEHPLSPQNPQQREQKPRNPEKLVDAPTKGEEKESANYGTQHSPLSHARPCSTMQAPENPLPWNLGTSLTRPAKKWGRRREEVFLEKPPPCNISRWQKLLEPTRGVGRRTWCVLHKTHNRLRLTLRGKPPYV